MFVCIRYAGVTGWIFVSPDKIHDVIILTTKVKTSVGFLGPYRTRELLGYEHLLFFKTQGEGP